MKRKIFAIGLVCFISLQMTGISLIASDDLYENIDSLFVDKSFSDSVDIEIPVLPENMQFDDNLSPTYTYEGDFVIASYEASPEEIEYGMRQQELHTHSELNPKARHINATPHTHYITNIQIGTDRTYTWYPSSIWVWNNTTSANGVSVSWTTSQSVSVSQSVSTSVGVDASVVSASVGSAYTKGHTVSTSSTITYPIQRNTEGRIKVTYARPYRTFTCNTDYFSVIPPGQYLRTERGSGNAIGAPKDIRAQLEWRYRF